jgi:NAD(P)-dependent dehydrogenase (short-subunit alcohol dehydrogenase family)
MAHHSTKQALVTGGTRGIGEGIARALAKAGYRVTACGLTQGELDRFTPQEHITTALLDVTNDASVAAVLNGFSSLDVLVNCAGIILREGKEFEIEGFRTTIEVNLNGTMRMCLAAKPLLAKAGGSIVNTASMLSFFGSAYAPGYAASKGAVAQLTKSLAAAWATDGIRVNAIAPGWIATELTQPLQDDAARTASIMARTPLNRWGTPDDLGGVVAFLASDAARFVTGTVLPVDGGYLTV